jgi:type IV secretory pathway TrbF-like protein
LPDDQFDPQTLAEIRQSWQDKIGRARQGEQRWGLFIAQKP